VIKMDRLKELKKSKGLTASDLAELSGVKLVTIQKLENGQNNIYMAKYDTIYKLSKALGVRTEYLVGLENTDE
jgi:transcriptional regulator with XRE-family HTH domain